MELTGMKGNGFEDGRRTNNDNMVESNNIDRNSASCHPGKPELWGGLECSITRVKDNYQDQLHLSRHYDRPEDLDLIADIGFKAFRFPILYERHQPVKGQKIDWGWASKSLNRLKENNITPIAGLVHHGSGPAFTSLLNKQFAKGVAAYASKVARKFPFLEYYTPVNEPLTTARFSGLYGHWYPHHHNDRSFCKMLINEITAVVLAMKEIRKINPDAKLVQTEDLGKTYAVRGLQYQADFENERRWLTFDLLCGRVDSDHAMWQFFINNGIQAGALEFFLQNPCPPDILGLNYYVTSERFLDDNLDGYPAHMHGGNHFEKYVDTEAVRVNHGQESGLPVLLYEVARRYSLPMALTEVHLHCTREEQARWFKEVWESCCQLKSEGLDIRAVTAWSLLGAYGWNKLLTSSECEYEPGVFDLRSNKPRPTLMTKLIKAYSTNQEFDHPVLQQPGWWKRKDRFHAADAFDELTQVNEQTRPLMIFGDGILTNALYSVCNQRSVPFINKNSGQFDLSLIEDIIAALSFFRPWAVASSYDGFAGSAQQSEINLLLAHHCQRNNIPFLYFSTSQVFESGSMIVHSESDLPDATSDAGMYYGKIEESILKENPGTLLIRTGKLFAPHLTNNFAYSIVQQLTNNKTVFGNENEVFSLGYLRDVVNTAFDLLVDGEQGVLHLANAEALSWFHFARKCCRHLNLPEHLVGHGQSESKMEHVILGSNRFKMPDVHCAIEHFASCFVSNEGTYRHSLQKR